MIRERGTGSFNNEKLRLISVYITVVEMYVLFASFVIYIGFEKK